MNLGIDCLAVSVEHSSAGSKYIRVTLIDIDEDDLEEIRIKSYEAGREDGTEEGYDIGYKDGVEEKHNEDK